MSQDQKSAYLALRKTLPPGCAKWFATHRKFRVFNRALLPAVIYPSPVHS